MKGHLFAGLVGENWLVKFQLSGMQGKSKRETRGARKSEE